MKTTTANRPKAQTVTLPEGTNPNSKFTTAHRNENKCYIYGWAVLDPQRLTWDAAGNQAAPVIECRIYGTGTANTACLWITSSAIGKRRELYVNGSGKATGYGYHRPSAAVQDAVTNAGITIAQPIDGVGDSAIETLLLAIGRALGIKRPVLVRCNQ